MMPPRTRARLALLAAAVIGAVIYLRDPAWLIRVDSGLFGWELNRARQRFRWMAGHASFFVPADARSVTIPLHALFATDDRRPFIIRVDLNGRPATQVVLPDEQWATVRVPIVLPSNWSRRVARIDLVANRTWASGEISVQVGEIGIDR
jgi:hypothetical protein